MGFGWWSLWLVTLCSGDAVRWQGLDRNWNKGLRASEDVLCLSWPAEQLDGIC